MKTLSIFLYEFKHFYRSPFKIVALLLFILASIYGLHTGADLYKKQNSEIERLSQKVKEDKADILSYYEKGEKGPKSRPWVDVTTSFWAIWYTPTYNYKKPSPTLVYNIGQTEHYGFYKKIDMYASPYDADMAKEIANPERIQSGTLDFAFVILFLLPLLLLVLLYNIKGLEATHNFLPLVVVQTGSKNWWMLSRTAFYAILLLLVLFALMLYGASLTNVFETSTAFWSIFILVTLYLLFWLVLYFLILKFGKNTVSNTLQMIGIWLLFGFIIPAAIQQWVSTEKPTNLMIDLIDTERDKKKEIYAQSDELTDRQLFKLFPSLKESNLAKDTLRIDEARSDSYIALINMAKKEATTSIEKDNHSKNELISKTYWFNPLTYFQNKLNHLTEAHYDDYQTYRDQIQHLVDKRIETMVLDTWNDAKVNKSKYLEYNTTLSNNE